MGKFSSIKKWLSVMLVVLLGFVVMAFVGCGEEATNNNANTNNNSSQTDNNNYNNDQPKQNYSALVSKLVPVIQNDVAQNMLGTNIYLDALAYYVNVENVGNIVNVKVGDQVVAKMQLNVVKNQDGSFVATLKCFKENAEEPEGPESIGQSQDVSDGEEEEMLGGFYAEYNINITSANGELTVVSMERGAVAPNNMVMIDQYENGQWGETEDPEQGEIPGVIKSAENDEADEETAKEEAYIANALNFKEAEATANVASKMGTAYAIVGDDATDDGYFDNCTYGFYDRNSSDLRFEQFSHILEDNFNYYGKTVKVDYGTTYDVGYFDVDTENGVLTYKYVVSYGTETDVFGETQNIYNYQEIVETFNVDTLAVTSMTAFEYTGYQTDTQMHSLALADNFYYKTGVYNEQTQEYDWKYSDEGDFEEDELEEIFASYTANAEGLLATEKFDEVYSSMNAEMLNIVKKANNVIAQLSKDNRNIVLSKFIETYVNNQMALVVPYEGAIDNNNFAKARALFGDENFLTYEQWLAENPVDEPVESTVQEGEEVADEPETFAIPLMYTIGNIRTNDVSYMGIVIVEVDELGDIVSIYGCYSLSYPASPESTTYFAYVSNENGQMEWIDDQDEFYTVEEEQDPVLTDYGNYIYYAMRYIMDGGLDNPQITA